MPLSTIGSNQITDGAIAVADVADGSITTAKLADNAVTTAKVNPAQTDITSVGTLTSFRSTGIDDNADAVALTIDSSERIGIGTTSPSEKLEINSGTGNIGAKIVSTDSLALIAYKDNTTSDVVLSGASGDNFAVSHDILFTNASKGIYLGVTSATSSNLLDDYEEGTFTAQISTDTTYVGDSAQLGVYTKIGDMVFFQIRFQRTGTLNSGVNARFGLPFTSANNAVQASGLRGSVENIDTSMVGIGGTIASNSAILFLNEMTSAITGSNVNGSDLGENFQVQIQGFYKT